MNTCYRYILTLILCITAFAAGAQQHQLAILDINSRNGDDENSSSGRMVYSAEYMAQVAGLSYFVTVKLNSALDDADMLLLSGPIKKNTFSDLEYDRLIQWVEDGGVIIAPYIKPNVDYKCLELFGIYSAQEKSSTHSTIKWIEQDLPELAYFDAPEEREFYIGNNQIRTAVYTPSTAQALAHYNGGDQVAVIKNTVGRGCVYAFGVNWKDVIQKMHLNQTGRDRTKNNRFDCSSDTYPLFLRACHVANKPVTVWKHTVPNGYRTVLIPTHDCDSRTALDEMHYLSDYEHGLGLRAHYFITTHYFRQPQYMSAFYCDETKPAIQDLIDRGHTVGSHSVCHLGDFSNTANFPMKVTTPDEYAAVCTYDPDAKVTTNGSTWAEIVMSKQLLEADFGNDVRSFRSGHLCVNTHFPEALKQGEYSYTSIYTANDVWGAFPFYMRDDISWTGNLTNVLQIPLHYSDVSPTGETMTADNWMLAPDIWLDVHQKLAGNYAPNVLLIHPNKEWKMQLLKKFVDMINVGPGEVGLCNFEDYGDFWTNRLGIDFQVSQQDGNVVVRANSADIANNPGLGFVVEGYGVNGTIRLEDEQGNEVNCRTSIVDNKQILVIGPTVRANVASGSMVDRGQYVRLLATASDCDIYYTVDGSEPTLASRSGHDFVDVRIDKDMTIKAICVEPDGQRSAVVTFEYALSKPLGDANGDGKLTADDTECMVDYMVKRGGDALHHGNADINMDDEITISDVAEVVDMLRGVASEGIDDVEAPRFVLSEINAPQGETVDWAISMSAETAIKGFQCELKIDGDLRLAGEAGAELQLTSAAKDHKLACNFDGDTYYIVVYSPTGAALGDGEVLTGKLALDCQGGVYAVTLNGIRAVAVGDNHDILCQSAASSITIDVAAESITLNRTQCSIGIDETVQLMAHVEPEGASSKPVTWTSQDPAIATVDANGMVTGKSAGTTVIIAACEEATAQCEVIVEPKECTEIHLSETAATMRVDEVLTLFATCDAPGRPMVWTSSDETVATVNDGEVRAVSPGTATIKVRCDNAEAKCVVTVNKKLQEIIWDQEFGEPEVGQTLTLEAYASSGLPVEYEIISGSRICKLQGDRLTPTALGVIKVQARQPGDTRHRAADPVTREIVVSKALAQGLGLLPPAIEIAIDESKVVEAMTTPAEITETILWSSADESVATVDANGRVTGVFVGQTVITATTQNCKAYCQVTVKPVECTSLVLSHDTAKMRVDETLALYVVELLPLNTTYPTVTWTSSNTSVATVDAYGVVTAVGTGTARIVASCGKASARCSIEVYKREQEIVWTQDLSTLRVDDVVVLTAESTAGLEITYEVTKGSKLCELEGNVLTLNEEGQIKIKASQPGCDWCKPAASVTKDFIVGPKMGISDVEADGVHITVEGTTLVVSGIADDVEIEVYTLTGQLVYRGYGRYVPLGQHHYYIVRCQGRAYKVNS